MNISPVIVRVICDHERHIKCIICTLISVLYISVDIKILIIIKEAKINRTPRHRIGVTPRCCISFIFSTVKSRRILKYICSGSTDAYSGKCSRLKYKQ